MEQNKEYYAFISYKREDEKWAEWLQNKLEHYKFPTNLNGRTDLPKNIRPTFRDVTDSTPGFLEKVINNALLKSEWLIVICSPRSAKSPWVCKEAQTFIDLGRADHIIPFIIEGIPFSNDVEKECYPDALLNLTGSKELLAANISEGGRDFAAVKVVAKMFDLGPDILWQRYERGQRRKRRLWAGVILLAALFGLGIGVHFAKLNGTIKNQNITLAKHILRIQNDSIQLARKNKSIISQNNLISSQRDSIEKSLNQLKISNTLLVEERNNLREANWRIEQQHTQLTADIAQDLLNKGDYITARLIAIELLHSDNINCNEIDPKTEFILRKSLEKNGWSMQLSSWNPNIISVSPNELVIAIVDGNKLSLCYSYSGRIKDYIDFDAYQPGYIPRKKIEYDFSGHDEPFFWRHDNEMVAQCFYNNTNNTCGIKIWGAKKLSSETINLGKGKISAAVFAYSYSKDFLYAKDSIVYISNLKSLETKPFLCGHSGIITQILSVHGIYYSQESIYITASTDGTIKIWDGKTGELKKTIIGHKNGVKQIIISGNVLVSTDGTEIIGRDINTSDVLFSINSGTKIDNLIKWDNRKTKTFATLRDGVVMLYSLKNGELVRTIDDHYYEEVCYSSKNEGFFSLSSDCNVRFYHEIDKSKWSYAYDCGTKGLSDITFTRDGKRILIASLDSKLYLQSDARRISKESDKKEFIGHTQPVNSVRFSPDEKLIISASSDSTVKIWDVERRCTIKTLRYKDRQMMSALYSPDGLFIASLDEHGHVYIHNTVNWRMIRDWDLKNAKKIIFSPNSEYILSISPNFARIWDVKTQKCVDSLKQENDFFFDASWCSKDNRIAIKSANYTIIWDINKSSVINRWRASGESITYSDDGCYIATGGINDPVRVWRVNGVLIKEFSNKTQDALRLEFSRDGKKISTVSPFIATCNVFDFAPISDILEKAIKSFSWAGEKLSNEERLQYLSK